MLWWVETVTTELISLIALIRRATFALLGKQLTASAYLPGVAKCCFKDSQARGCR